jgi:hypothetical protein
MFRYDALITDGSDKKGITTLLCIKPHHTFTLALSLIIPHVVCGFLFPQSYKCVYLTSTDTNTRFIWESYLAEEIMCSVTYSWICNRQRPARMDTRGLRLTARLMHPSAFSRNRLPLVLSLLSQNRKLCRGVRSRQNASTKGRWRVSAASYNTQHLVLQRHH